jgi:hypothetical protein
VRKPLVPVTVTLNVPPVVLVQESSDFFSQGEFVEVTVVGLIVHASPVLGVIEVVRDTMPVNIFPPATIMVDVPGVPIMVMMVLGLEVIAKFEEGTTVKVMLVTAPRYVVPGKGPLAPVPGTPTI